jgi:hypothetical protein
MVKAPVGRNHPLVSFPVDSEDFGFKGFIGRQVEVLPGGFLIVNLNSKCLNRPKVNRNGDRGERRLVTSLDDLCTLADGVPNGWNPGG